MAEELAKVVDETHERCPFKLRELMHTPPCTEQCACLCIQLVAKRDTPAQQRGVGSCADGLDTRRFKDLTLARQL